MMRLRLSVCRVLVYMAVGLAVAELCFINIALLYILTIPSKFDYFFSDSDTLGNKLMKVPIVKQLVFRGKEGGFAYILKNTVDRLFLVSERNNVSSETHSLLSQFDRSDMSYLAFDVSSDGEALFLIRRIKQRGPTFFETYRQLVIDIGANDGLTYSNSFNLIQLGWDAILVEPQISLLQMAQENLKRYADPYNEQNKVILVNAVLGQQDGTESLVLMENDMESHILRAKHVDTAGKLVVTVTSMTVGTFAHKYNIPTHFAVLSIDAEGMGDKILHQWLDGGFRPAYIVYESLNNKEKLRDTSSYLALHGYHFMIHLGWNFIFEHQPQTRGTRN